MAKLYLDEDYYPLTKIDKTTKEYIITYEFEVDQNIVDIVEKYDLIIKSLYKLTSDTIEIFTINIPNIGNITKL
jgi:hypothetical protein